MGQKGKILVIGGASLDITCISKEQIVQQDSNPSVIYYSHGGVGRNIAENMVRLGLNTSFVSVFGDDVLSKNIIHGLEILGVDCSKTRIMENRRVSTYISILDNDVELSLGASDFSLLDNLNADYFREIEEYIRGFDIVFIDGNLERDALDFLAQIEGIRIFADGVSYKKVLKLLAVMDRLEYIKINLNELRALTGMDILSEEDLAGALDLLLNKGVKRIFLTMGANGALSVTKEHKYWIRGRVLSVLNITGAGDAFAAASAYAYMNSMTDREALGLASAAAEITLDSHSTVSDKMTEENLLQKYNSEYESEDNYLDFSELKMEK